MANLNAWQKIDRVLPGLPFGNGVSGSATVSSDPNTRATANGSSTTLAIGSAILSDGDVFAVYQTMGTGAGQWEINRVASGGGTTNITCQVALQYTYGAGAQVIKIPLYTTATISSHSITGWNGSVGGVEIICAKNSITGTATITGTGLGFRGGAAVAAFNPRGAACGEGTNHASSTSSSTLVHCGANGNGGGGGGKDSDSTSGSPGAGGGNGATGQQGSSSDVAWAAGGVAGGVADLTSFVLGGGGGGGRNDSNGGAGNGGNGGATLILITNSLEGNVTIALNGNAGGNSSEKATGGGGAGGTLLGVFGKAALGTITATGGSGGLANGADNNGDGGTGRIAIHHSGTVTGTTNPTFEDITDGSLYDSNAGFIFNMI